MHLQSELLDSGNATRVGKATATSNTTSSRSCHRRLGCLCCRNIQARCISRANVSTSGRLLKVSELNDKRLVGLFVTSGNTRIAFESRCSGYLRLKHGSKTFLEIENVRRGSAEGLLYYAKIRSKSFVYDKRLQHVFELPSNPSDRHNKSEKPPNSRRSRRSVEEHWHRSKRSGAPTAKSDLAAEENELTRYSYYRHLPQLAQALGELGISASITPCAKPVLVAGYEVEKQIHSGLNVTAMDDVMDKANERRKKEYNKKLAEMKKAKPREKRF